MKNFSRGEKTVAQLFGANLNKFIQFLFRERNWP